MSENTEDSSQANSSESLNKKIRFKGLYTKKNQKEDYVLLQFLKNLYYIGLILTE